MEVGSEKRMQLMTRFGREVDPEAVLLEYPRPSLKRDSYWNLNGTWRLSVKRGQETLYQGPILVPFSPEAPLSGVERKILPGERLFYEREFFLSSKKGQGRYLLHFGAVDQRARVFVNRVPVFTQETVGGYYPFTCDITQALKEGENLLEVEAWDDMEREGLARGKQSLSPEGMWYTAQSGIWQTVWMEWVPPLYIRRLCLTPDLERGSVRVRVEAFLDGGEEENPGSQNQKEGKRGGAQGELPTCQVSVFLRGSLVGRGSGKVGESFEVSLQEKECWSPENPVLYEVTVRLLEDEVTSYFGLRRVSLEKDERGLWRFFLNGSPYFQNGLLDQGYYPEGLYTPPTDEAMVWEIQRMKSLGFNMLRMHAKISCERWYYHCDRLGMLVWQDMVNGGSPYNMSFTCNLPNILPFLQRRIRDWGYVGGKEEVPSFFLEKEEKNTPGNTLGNTFGSKPENKPGKRRGKEKAVHRAERLGRGDAGSQLSYLREMEETIRLLSGHPSIVCWVLFNEGWGQFEALEIEKRARQLDPTRLIDHASGWFDQGGGDMVSIHNYFFKLRVRPDPKRAVALTECGGYSWWIPEHSLALREYGYRKFHSRQELTLGIERLYKREILPAIARGLCASIYTQVSDIENEVNGLLTYDREVLKVEEERIKRLNDRVYETFLECTKKAID